MIVVCNEENGKKVQFENAIKAEKFVLDVWHITQDLELRFALYEIDCPFYEYDGDFNDDNLIGVFRDYEYIAKGDLCKK
ncbi:hypothetical protein [uncultured Arcobacter sp.]|mgnify:CR=1 FL=1|uniref:hypothetical protein n=1 Tax=uncultured Arcobacter sp. TaxID=165434 RepID=UPI00261BBA12|nr:hypothetical protein [uncultured Arcobacter sp.]